MNVATIRKAESKNAESRLELRVVSRLNMISSLIDVLAIPLGLVGVFSIHGPALVREIFAAFRSAKTVERRLFALVRVFDRIMNLHFFAQIHMSIVHIIIEHVWRLFTTAFLLLLTFLQFHFYYLQL